jgi:hypothetical protein
MFLAKGYPLIFSGLPIFGSDIFFSVETTNAIACRSSQKEKRLHKTLQCPSQPFCASLVATIKEVMGNLDTDTVAKAVVEANGDFLK